MDKAKQAKLEAAGWSVATPKERLNLTEEETILVEVKVAFASALRARRIEQQLTQTEAARRLRSSQSRVVKMESADRSVSLDLLLRSFLKLGGTRDMVAAVFTAR